MLKKILGLTIVLGLMLNVPVSAAEKPDIYGQYGIAIDATTGEVLYAKNAEEKAYPASVTKVMTALLLDEYIKDGEMITVSKFAAGQEGSNAIFRVKEGEKLSKRDALYSMLIMSANDVAVAIGEHISGSQEEFAKLMTKKAKELGAKHTHFMTANGLHDPNHYTTAHDMALIVKEAIKHPEVLKAMDTKEFDVVTSKQKLHLVNHGKVHETPYSIGGKTGFTNAAGNTLTMVMEKNGKRVIGVVFKSSGIGGKHYKDVSAMANYAFDQMKTKNVIEKNEVVKTETIHHKKVKLLTKQSLAITYSQAHVPVIKKEVKMKTINKTTIAKGEKVGYLNVYQNGKLIDKIDLVSDREVVAKKIVSDETSNRLFMTIVVLFPIVGYGSYLIVYNIKRRKRIREERGLL